MRYTQSELVNKLKQAGYTYSRQRINKLVKDGKLLVDKANKIDYDEAIGIIGDMRRTTTPGQSLTQSKSKKEKWLARLRELEVKEKEGKLVDLKTVLAVEFKRFRLIKEALQNIPPRIAPILVSMTDSLQIELFLKQEIAASLKDLTNESNGNGKDNQSNN